MDRQIPRQEVFLAAEHGNVKGLTILEKDFGIESLKIMDDEGFTLMSYAAANGHESVIRYLIQKGLDCNAPNMYGWSPLMQAAYYGWLPAVGRLLEGGARINDVNNLGTTALLCACKNGYYSIAEMLIKKGANVNVSEENNCGFTPLMAACQLGNEQMVRLLLTHGADPNAKLKGSGWTALMLASLNNHKEVVKILLSNGADKECANACGKNALVICCEVENQEIATILHGGKPYKMEKKRGFGSSLAKKSSAQVDLFEASKQGNVLAVNELMAADKQGVHAVDKDGATPLMFAAMRGHTEVCRALISGGSKIDAQDYRSGWTAFMQAIHHKQHEVAKLLIEYGADVNLRATNGCGAFEVATFNGDIEMVQLIASIAMGKKSKTVTDDKEKGRSRKISLQEKRSRLKAVKPIEDDADLLFESPGKQKEPEFMLKKHQSEVEISQSLVKKPHHSCSMEVTDEQMVPAPPDFSVSPSPSVLLDRVRKALNTEPPKAIEPDVAVQRFPSSRQQQAKGYVESELSHPTQKTDHIKPAAVEKSKANSNESTKAANQNAPAAKPFTTAMEPNRRTVTPVHPPASVESDWSPPVTRTNLPNHIPHPVSTTVDHPKQSAPPTTTNSFQKFLMKKTAQTPSGDGASDPAKSKNSRDFTDSSPKPTKSSLMTDIGNSSPKHSGLPKELPPSILNRLAKNVVRGKPSRQQYGNIASSGDLIANLAMRYGKQPVGGAARVQDPMPMKQQPVKPVVATPASVEHVITEESDLAEALKQFSLDRFIPIFEEHEVDMSTFLSMTNTDLEEVGITDAEEKLNILDAIVEIKLFLPDIDKVVSAITKVTDRMPTSLGAGQKASVATRNIPSSFAYQNFHKWS